jgi:hypothetical protein
MRPAAPAAEERLFGGRFFPVFLEKQQMFHVSAEGYCYCLAACESLCLPSFRDKLARTNMPQMPQRQPEKSFLLSLLESRSYAKSFSFCYHFRARKTRHRPYWYEDLITYTERIDRITLRRQSQD